MLKRIFLCPSLSALRLFCRVPLREYIRDFELVVDVFAYAVWARAPTGARYASLSVDCVLALQCL